MAIEQGEDGDRELFNEVFRCLQHPERRRILFQLLDLRSQEELMVPEDVHVGEQPMADLTIGLVHSHLPLLEDVGLIQWDRDADRVQKGPTYPEIRELLESVSEHDPIER